ncbi:hypothetical protein EDB86DRAFT_3088576 [Lactarius hatsudake]|nr:hypothetical protein EDB86DRAFT_3088576 [Lactarius hatsudake]
MACAKHDNLVTKTKVEFKKAPAGTDMFDLRASFCHTLSFSIPPLTLYRDCRLGAYSDLVFSETNEDNVPKVMRLCVEEVEMTGPNNIRFSTAGGLYDDTEVLELRRRFESDKTFSFSYTDNICSVTMLPGITYYKSLNFISDLSSSSTSGIFQSPSLFKISKLQAGAALTIPRESMHCLGSPHLLCYELAN